MQMSWSKQVQLDADCTANTSTFQHAPETWGKAEGGEKTQDITDATIIVLLITAKFATCGLHLYCGLYESVWLETRR